MPRLGDGRRDSGELFLLSLDLSIGDQKIRKRPSNRQFRKLVGFSRGSLRHLSWYQNTVKQNNLGAGIISERGSLEPHQFPERRVVGLLLFAQKSLSLAKNHPKPSQEFSEQSGPLTHKIKVFGQNSPPKVHPNFAKNLGRQILGNTCSGPNSSRKPLAAHPFPEPLNEHLNHCGARSLAHTRR